MRALLLLPFVSTLTQAAPPPPSLAEASERILQAFEEDPAPDRLPVPAVRAKDRLGRNWLLACLREELPLNPFPAGSQARREAEALRSFLREPPEQQAKRMAGLSLALPGTQAALWRWGQGLSRRGAMPKPLRHTWEDRLLAKGGHPVIQGWALRHAFCFALAEADEARFARIKEVCQKELPDLAQSFQRAFALLGGPPPRIYLWSLPGLEPLDLPLSRLGPCLAITPLEPGTPRPSLGCTWIIPCLVSNQPVGLSTLEEASLKEAQGLAEQVRSLDRPAYLAPSRDPFLDCALAYFPIEIRLNAQGLIEGIRMGDAALAAQAKPMP